MLMLLVLILVSASTSTYDPDVGVEVNVVGGGLDIDFNPTHQPQLLDSLHYKRGCGLCVGINLHLRI